MTARMIGHKEVIDALKNADKVVNEEGKRFLDELGKWTSGRAKAYTMDAGSVDLGELVQGIHHTTKSVSSGLETTIRPSDAADKYATYVEHGTPPHFPPISALQGWADRHGIPVWAVARKIARDGTEPRWMWRDTFNDLQAKVGGETNRFADKLVGKI